MSACCCCDCVCSNDRTEDTTCCGCFPVKCGIVTIGFLTFCFTIILFVWYFFEFMNDYVHWWSTMINLILLCPFLVSCAFFICFSTRDSLMTRGLLPTACILCLCSIVCIMLWQVIYFVFIYKRDAFYQGYGKPDENPYQKQSKKNFLFTLLAESGVLIALYAYFLCVTWAYKTAMRSDKEKEKEEMQAMEMK